ncbi:MAG: IS630 family transposase [Halobacteriota archaeon]|nr:IS630 family transposase [Halobacteriota archaeon]
MKAYSIDFRRKIIKAHEDEEISQRELAKRFGVALSFVQKLLKRYRETDSVGPKRRTQQTPSKLTPGHLAVLRRLVEEQNDATLEELRERLIAEIQVSVSRSTIDRALKKLGFDIKKKTFHADEKESERVQLKRVEFWELVRGILAKDLIFIDESGVNLALTRLQARAPKGQRAHGKRPQKRGQNVSIVGALSFSGLLTSTSIMGAFDGLTFEAFISQRLVPKLWPGACVIMDNCSIHLGKDIEEMIHQAGASLLYLPPYSPEFSPIENLWSKVKSILRSLEARTYPDLAKALEKAFEEVSLEDIENWFTNCCYCTSLE